ncbi:hyperpolarization-activated voltage-gated potassium channel [Methanocaldococcus fervens]|uniref:Ion transport 2 domain protein n=1 Tax=Methanocaldococcus fervens (strain DSM 4213 / JCM 15782 / AG86) TaxID=573064 RepID=C7P6L2_METFA|nr:hyperpolarization-activated voltage-gated potassium channel [Methanocaldococcus fervens]ACV24194.1 Ion transport 2 domain protein [Methanocaldococcus fervens AG86]
MRLKDKKFKKIIEVLSLIFTFEIIASFILSTYNPPYQDLLIKLDYISIIFFTFEIIYNFYYSESRVEFFKDVYNIVDAIVIIAFLLYSLEIFYSKALFGLRVINLIRILVMLRIIKLKRVGENPALMNFLTIFIFCFISSCLVWVAESEANPSINNFFDAFYFTVISVATVGYGDITPKTDAGKFIIVFSVLFFISGLITSLQKALRGEIK